MKRIPPALRRTLTERCGIDICFAEPRSPWQRPTNENGNGIIRRYVGKRTDLSIYTSQDLRAIETRINITPPDDDQAVAVTP